MIRTKRYYVYILASLSGTLYIGITDNLERRMVEHKEGPNSGFHKKIRRTPVNLFRTVQRCSKRHPPGEATKGWRREKKAALIKTMNPNWKDLAKEWYEGRGPSTRDRDKAAVARSG